MNGKLLKRALAASLAMMIVSGSIPMLPVSDLFLNTAITASAETKSIANGVTYNFGDMIDFGSSNNTWIQRESDDPSDSRTLSGKWQLSCDGFQTGYGQYRLILSNSQIGASLAFYVSAYYQGDPYGVEITGSGTQADPYFFSLRFYEPHSIVIDALRHGTVTAPQNARLNDKVTLNVTPNDGFRIKSVTVNGRNLDPVSGAYSFKMPDSEVNVSAVFVPDSTHFSQYGDTYTIRTDKGWNAFCECISDSDYDHFNGKTVVLDADITAKNKAGVVSGSDQVDAFSGVFEGGGHTITAAISDTDNQGTAPFCYIEGAEIRDLTVSGSITGTLHAAGVVGFSKGSGNKIENCVVTATINGGSHVGGILGHGLSSDIEINNCVFAGLIKGGDIAKGVFFGWGDGFGDKSIKNCLFIADRAQEDINLGLAMMCAGSVSAENCYSTIPLDSAYGKHAVGISSADDVAILLEEGSAGIQYNDVVFAAPGEEISLSFEYTGELFDRLEGFTVELHDGKLTVPDTNVFVEAMIEGVVRYKRVSAVPPTCTEDGNIEYYIGSDDNLYKLVNGTYIEISQEDTVVPATGHLGYWIEWNWDEDNNATAKFTCNAGDDEQFVDADVTCEITYPTYKEEGLAVYTATVIFLDEEYTDTREVVLDRLTMTHYDAVEPTCTEDGNIEYWFNEDTGSYFSDEEGENEITADDTVIPATGHSFGKPRWTWNDDNTAFAEFVCEKCGETETVKANVTVKTTPATTTSDGKNVYIAVVTFNGKGYSYQKTVVIPKLTYTAPVITYQKGDGAVKLSWTSVEGADGYAVAAFVNGKWQKVTELRGTSYVLSGLKAGSKYKVAVITRIDGKWFTDISNAVIVTPNAVHAYPEVSAQVQGNAFRLSWNAVPNAQQYAVGYLSADNKWHLLTTLKSTSCTMKNVPSGSYKLVVVANVDGKWDLTDISGRAFTVTIK